MIVEKAILFLGGFLAGTLGGLLGIGGGIVLMPMLRFLLGLTPAHAVGTCVLAVFFTAVGGGYRHYCLGHLDLRSIAPVIVSGGAATAVFSLAFAFMAGHGRWLDLGIGLVFSMVSIRMVAEGVPGVVKPDESGNTGNRIEGGLMRKVSIGSIAGVLPGLLGIGSGVILVPAFTYLFRAPVKVAMASSLACFSVNALVSSGFKFGQGYIDLGVALPICLGTLLGANLGAVLNRRFPSQTLKLLFGLVFSYVSIKFILSFWEVGI